MGIDIRWNRKLINAVQRCRSSKVAVEELRIRRKSRRVEKVKEKETIEESGWQGLKPNILTLKILKFVHYKLRNSARKELNGWNIMITDVLTHYQRQLPQIYHIKWSIPIIRWVHIEYLMTNIWIINSNQIATISHSINYRPQHIKRENTTNNMSKKKTKY